MTESDVKLTVKTALEIYEKHTGLPRHEENLANFASLFEIANKFKGAISFGAVIVGLPTVAASLIVIIKFIQGKS